MTVDRPPCDRSANVSVKNQNQAVQGKEESLWGCVSSDNRWWRWLHSVREGDGMWVGFVSPAGVGVLIPGPVK